MSDEINFKEIEAKWAKFWEEHPELSSGVDNDAKRKKFYVLVEFPYPSGAGLHIGHARSWTAMDIYSRKKRMEGYNVMYPIGWDAFGLPAENYALKLGVHPSKIVPKNIAKFKEQCKAMGLSFDWNREIDTTDPKYYKWTQWIFLQLYKKSLAKRMETQVNWCPFCKTTLANEEVNADGTHERCDKPTEKKTQKQWVIKITEYADRLIDDLKLVDYSPNIAAQQVKWIGKSEGARIKFQISNFKFKNENESFLEVFTTRPDTLFGATFMVVAPEHKLVSEIIKNPPLTPPLKKGGENSPFVKGESGEAEEDFDLNAVKNYVINAGKKSEMERTEVNKEKTGVFSGLYAINPATGKEIPIWISDFVLAAYGTGAIMAVPAHDERDFAFAKKFKLPIVPVVMPDSGHDFEKEAYTDVTVGKIVNSSPINGLTPAEAFKKMIEWLVEYKIGEKANSYHLRDWIFSRQHYWGEPIPMVWCEKCGEVPVPEDQLPVELPYVEKYEPSGTGESPLANIAEWVNTVCPKCGGAARRETDTMPNWAGSNWYYVRYLDRDNDKELATKEKMNYWLPVDIYQGGFEHTTLHLLYSRFIYKFLYDIGVVPGPEPYAKRRSHGIVLGADGNKMSKSFGNVINPEDVISRIGADALRVYEMFMGPFDQMVAWSDESASGCQRFLLKTMTLFKGKVSTDKKEDDNLSRKLNKTINKVGADIENFKFNTTISTMMEFVNFWQQSEEGLTKEQAKAFLKLLAPFAPFMAEEVWSWLKDEKEPISVFLTNWPKVEEKYLIEEEVNVAVAINGKVREQLTVKSDELRVKEEVIKKAKELEGMKKWLEGKEIVKEFYVPGRMINFVIKG